MGPEARKILDETMGGCCTLKNALPVVITAILKLSDEQIIAFCQAAKRTGEKLFQDYQARCRAADTPRDYYLGNYVEETLAQTNCPII